MVFTENFSNVEPMDFEENDQDSHNVVGYKWEHSMDISGEIGLMAKGMISLDQAADLIAERIKLLPSYAKGDAELNQIVNNLQSLPVGEDERQADFYATMEWLKDWGDHGRRLFVQDFAITGACSVAWLTHTGS